MKQSKSLLPVDKLAFTQYRYFVFGRRAQGDGESVPSGAYCLTSCSVKGSVGETYQPLRGTKGPNKAKGFLRHPPDLDKIPDTETKALGVDIKDEVTKRLNAVETRIGNASKMSQLLALRDEVYGAQSRSLPFSWSPECVERRAVESLKAGSLQGQPHHGNTIDEGLDSDHSDDEHDNEYELGTFVAVRTNTSAPFWIGQIYDIETGPSGLARQLLVNWYEAKKGGEEFNSKFVACVANGRPVQGIASVHTVLVTFDGFNRDNRLPAEVRKNIRSAVADVVA